MRKGKAAGGGGEGSRPEAAKSRGYAEVTSCLC